MKKFKYDDIKEIFDSYPEPFRTKLLFLREMIFEVAKMTPEVGEIEEDLRWREPSYLTLKSNSGSVIRMDWKPKFPNQYALYFHCKTSLISDFKKKYGSLFKYEGNRSIIFKKEDKIPKKELRDCIKTALTYKLYKDNPS